MSHCCRFGRYRCGAWNNWLFGWSIGLNRNSDFRFKRRACSSTHFVRVTTLQPRQHPLPAVYASVDPESKLTRHQHVMPTIRYVQEDGLLCCLFGRWVGFGSEVAPGELAVQSFGRAEASRRPQTGAAIISILPVRWIILGQLDPVGQKGVLHWALANMDAVAEHLNVPVERAEMTRRVKPLRVRAGLSQ